MGQTQSGFVGGSAIDGGSFNDRARQYAQSARDAAAAAPEALNRAAANVTAATQAAANLAEAAAPAVNAMQLAMANVSSRQGGAVLGGADAGYFGGNSKEDPAKDLREYEASLSAKAKEDVIRRLARALKRAGINVDADGDLDVIVKELVAQIPNPRKGKTFSDDAKAQEKVCRVIADVLNDEFSPGATKAADKFIDTSLGAVAICRSVGEWAHSFASGVNTEFLAVHTSVRNALRNSEILGELMRDLYNKITTSVSNDGPSSLARDVAPFDEMYRRAQSSHKEQQELIKNILHVTLAPAAKELELAMRDESESNALIKKLGLKPGTSEFADSLAMAISGLGTAAAVAARVHNALKQVGLSVSKYLDSGDFKALKRALDDKLMSGDIKTDDVAKFLEAIQTLRATFDRRSDTRFREALEATGGADDERSAVDKRVTKQRTERKIIIKNFVERTNSDYENILQGIKTLADDIGKGGFPINDHTDQLRDAIRRFGDMHADRIELSLIGFYYDASAREKKERFQSELRMLAGIIEDLLGLEAYRGAAPHLSQLKAGLENLSKTIDFFADVVRKKYGGNSTEATGGAEVLEDYLPAVSRSGVSLKESTNAFEYKYYIAKVRRNLDQTSKELDTYGDKYVSMLGDAVATRLKAIAAKRVRAINVAKRDKTTEDAAAPAAAGAARTAALKLAKNKFDAREEFLKTAYNTKMKFYKALQAIDLYMKLFTGSIANDPDAVRDMKRILDGLDVIARWFSETTGDSLAKAFDCGWSLNISGPNVGTRGRASRINDVVHGAAADRVHYYDRVMQANAGAAAGVASLKAGAAAVPANSSPGDPSLGFALDGNNQDAFDEILTRTNDAKRAVGEVYDNFQALKNLVNAFSRIGDKFGGKEIRSQVFMSPTQIYKALTDYLKISAISMSHRLGPEDGPPDADGDGPITWANANTGTRAASRIGYASRINAYKRAGLGDVHVTALMAQLAAGHADWAALVAAAVPGTAAAVAAIAVPANFEWVVYFSSTDPAAVGNFEFEDKYFVFVVKAMAAKVMTVAGVFDMFERPKPVYDVTPIRMIIGGACDKERPPVLDGAADLYFRLPRLVEYYLKLFPGMNNDAGLTGDRIAMLPEVEGIFTGIVRLIFQRARAAADAGSYSDSEVREMVSEINAIYESFRDKGEDRVTLEVVTAFIKEINRRYGVVKAEEITKYWNFVNDMRTTARRESYNQTSYSILPGEDEDEVQRRAPSDQYMTPDAEAAAKLEGKYNVHDATSTEANFQLVRELRDRVDQSFRDVEVDYDSVSFATHLKQSRLELKRTSSEDERWNIALRLIQSGNTSSIDPIRALMFHETVVSGLNTLSGVYTLLDTFNTRINGFDTVRIHNLIESAAISNAAGAVGANPLNSQAAVRALPNLGADSANYIVTGIHNNNVGSVRFGGALNGGGNPILAYGRIDGAAANATTRDLYSMANAGHCNGDTPGATASRRVFLRYVINYQAAMRDFLVSLYQISSSFEGLVEVRYPGTPEMPIQLDFSKLRSACDCLMANVRKNLDIYRPHMSRETIRRYEDRSFQGSVYWLEENLMDRIIRGVPERAVDAAENASTLDNISRRLTANYAFMIRDHEFGWNGMTAANVQAGGVGALGAQPLPLADAHQAREPYSQVLAGLIFYDATVNDTSGVVAVGGNLQANWSLGGLVRMSQKPFPPNPGAATVEALQDTYPWSRRHQVTINGAAGNVAAATRNAAANVQRLLFWTNANEMTDDRSLMFKYNQLIARLITTCTDAPTGRIYLNLVNGFANGAASSSVRNALRGGASPDITNGGTWGRRGDPLPNATLLLSNALALQRIVSDTNPATQVSEHLVSSLIDVPLYIKETLRGALPGFTKLFNLVIRESEMYKQVMQRTNISLWRPAMTDLTGAANGTLVRVAIAANGGVGAVAINNYNAAGNHPYPENTLASIEPFTNVATPSGTVKQSFATIVDSISGGAYALADSCQQVLKELSDVGVYFETGEGTIQSYKARYGKEPLMPVSLALWYMRNLGEQNGESAAMPISSGSPEAEVQYGVRQLLTTAGKVGYGQIPGTKTILDMYNGLATPRDRISESDHLDTLTSIISLTRFVVDVHKYSTMMAIPDGQMAAGVSFARVDLITAAGPIRRADGAGMFRNAVFALGNAGGIVRSAPDIVEVVKSSDQEGQIRLIANSVSDVSATSGSRDSERVHNIIDLNVIPINVHALMRDVPLVNTYNYVYTFEQLAALMYNQNSTAIRALNGGTTRSARQMFLRLLFDPYMPINPANAAAEYGSSRYDLGSGGFIHRIFRGDSGLGMGRPKFLSDQMFNKSLFGNLYTSKSDYDESGPISSAATARGDFGLLAQTVNDDAAGLDILLAAGALGQLPAAAGANAAEALLVLLTNPAAIPIAGGPAISFDDAMQDAITRMAHFARLPAADALRQAIGIGMNAATTTRSQTGILLVAAASAIAAAPGDAALANVDAALALAVNLSNTDTRATRTAFHVALAADIAAAVGGAGAVQAALQGILNGVAPGIPVVGGVPGGANLGAQLQALCGDGAADRGMDWRAGVLAVLPAVAPAFRNAAIAAISQQNTVNNLRPQQPNMVEYHQTSHRRAKLTYTTEAPDPESDDPRDRIMEVDVPGPDRAILEEIGLSRFNTRLTRNLFFITNVLRLVRQQLSRELSMSRSVIAKSHDAINPSIMEYGSDPFGPHETYGSHGWSDAELTAGYRRDHVTQR